MRETDCVELKTHDGKPEFRQGSEELEEGVHAVEGDVAVEDAFFLELGVRRSAYGAEEWKSMSKHLQEEAQSSVGEDDRYDFSDLGICVHVRERVRLG